MPFNGSCVDFLDDASLNEAVNDFILCALSIEFQQNGSFGVACPYAAQHLRGICQVNGDVLHVFRLNVVESLQSRWNVCQADCRLCLHGIAYLNFAHVLTDAQVFYTYLWRKLGVGCEGTRRHGEGMGYGLIGIYMANIWVLRKDNTGN